jgi:hypothetical protein
MVLVISMPGKKVLKCHFMLCPYEKELPEWRSSVFHHKSTPVYTQENKKETVNCSYMRVVQVKPVYSVTGREYIWS